MSNPETTSSSPASISPTEPKKIRVHRLYKLTDTTNGKEYVGQTVLTPVKRSGGEAGGNYSHCALLYPAIQAAGGMSKFLHEDLATTTDQKEANELEDHFIELHNTREPNGYNKKQGGKNGAHAQSTIAQISQTQMGHEVSDGTRQKISELHLGVPKPKHTDEWKEENSIRTKLWHANHEHPMQGKHHSEETRKAISEKNKGRIVSPEQTAKRIETMMKPKEALHKAVIADYTGTTMPVDDIVSKHSLSGAPAFYRIIRFHKIPLRSKSKVIV